MKKFISFIIVMVVLAIVALCTNPSFDVQKDKIKKDAAECVQDLVTEKTQDNNSIPVMVARNFIGDKLIQKAVNILADNCLEYHNYYIFSKCTTSFGEDKQMVSFGMFGHVFFSKSTLRKAIEEKLP